MSLVGALYLTSLGQKSSDLRLSWFWFIFVCTFFAFLSSPLERQVEDLRSMPLFSAQYSRPVGAYTPKPYSDQLDSFNGSLFSLPSNIFKHFLMYQNVVMQLLSC